MNFNVPSRHFSLSAIVQSYLKVGTEFYLQMGSYAMFVLLWIEEGAGMHEVVNGVGERGKAGCTKPSRFHPRPESQ
jgi:hypothetical protein